MKSITENLFVLNMYSKPNCTIFQRAKKYINPYRKNKRDWHGNFSIREFGVKKEDLEPGYDKLPLISQSFDNVCLESYANYFGDNLIGQTENAMQRAAFASKKRSVSDNGLSITFTMFAS